LKATTRGSAGGLASANFARRSKPHRARGDCTQRGNDLDPPAAMPADPTNFETRAPGPLALYRQRGANGSIRPDAAQERALERLDALHQALLHHAAVRPGLLARLGFGQAAGTGGAAKGLYLWGPVGRGKSMLMDLFFAAAPVPHKRRVHFHAFMLEVHDRIEAERRKRSRQPILRVAAMLAAEATLLCFDEFQVNDIADAMILERLFRALFDAGTVIVATSNRHPERLYEHGLQRDRFLPFIALLQERLDVVELDSGRDYRLARMIGRPVYFQPLGDNAHRALVHAFADLTEGHTEHAETLTVMARPLHVPRCAGHTAWFSFTELCEKPHSAVDYLALVERFAALVVEGIPRLAPQQRNAAQRFHILIDTLYEARTLLVASAAAPPQEIYIEGDGSFEFQRTVSRLMEMQSEDYIAATPTTENKAHNRRPDLGREIIEE
jgi:cell division protein ZapE